MNRGVDSDDPQLTELAFLRAAVTERERAGSQQGFLDGPQFLAAGTAKAFSGFEKTFFGLPSGMSDRCTHR